jgi:hypothetical protein
MNEKAQHLAQKSVIGWASDPGHSWLVVNASAIDGFPVALQFASQWSFIDDAQHLVYLEEDDDAPAFIRKYNLDGRAWQTYQLPDDNQIRDFPRGKAMNQAQQFIDDHFKIITVS